MDEQSNENVLNYDISYKNLISAKPLHFMFDQIEGFMREYDRMKHLVFGSEKNDTIFDRIKKWYYMF